tara:strand:- start:5147 stop:5704 length:558 start_codon:yes stop_codon:yes gene_type:complete
MITECIIFLASFGVPDAITFAHQEHYYIENHRNCNQSVPEKLQDHAGLFYEFFDEENIDTAIRISWCESRGKTTAHRTDNGDSGLMQFVSWTWNWVAEKYDLPVWDEYVIMRWGRPYTENKIYKHDIGFEQTKVQFTPYYNIMFASILAEDIYGRTQWRDWSSSEWCWGDEKFFHNKWRKEVNGY